MFMLIQQSIDYDPATYNPISAWYNEVTTNWQPFAIVKLHILNSNLTPNILFNTSVMNGNEFYVIPC